MYGPISHIPCQPGPRRGTWLWPVCCLIASEPRPSAGTGLASAAERPARFQACIGHEVETPCSPCHHAWALVLLQVTLEQCDQEHLDSFRHSQESFDLDHLLPDCIGEYRAGSTRPLRTDQEQTLFSFWPPEVGYDIINYNERGRNPGQGRLLPPTLISICEGGVGVGKYTIPAWNQAPGPGSRMGPEMSVP